MSLINDALKRVTKASPAPGAAESGDSGEPMRPTDQHQSVGLPRFFFPVLLCIFCGALWFLVRGWETRRLGATGPNQSLSVQAREVGLADPARFDPRAVADPLDAIPLDEILVVPDENTPIPSNRNFALDDPAPSGRADVAALAKGAPAGTPTGFRLQGIFYRASAASAVINAETVYVGDTVAGARVKSIGRDSVTLERGGRMEVLTLRR